MVFELLAIHEISEEMAPADLGWPLQIGRAISVKEFSQTCHPSSWVEEAERCSGVHPQSGRVAGSISSRHITLNLL